MEGDRRWYCGVFAERTGGGREAGLRKVCGAEREFHLDPGGDNARTCLDMINFAMDRGTSDWYMSVGVSETGKERIGVDAHGEGYGTDVRRGGGDDSGG